MKHSALVMNLNDNVATVLADVSAGDEVAIQLDRECFDLQAQEYVPGGHKIALRNIDAGDMVRKYGQTIGIASKSIQQGRHVHVHNLESCRGRGDKR